MVGRISRSDHERKQNKPPNHQPTKLLYREPSVRGSQLLNISPLRDSDYGMEWHATNITPLRGAEQKKYLISF